MDYFDRLKADREVNLVPILRSLKPKDYIDGDSIYAVIGESRRMILPIQTTAQLFTLITDAPFILLNRIKSNRLYLRQISEDAKSIGLGTRSFSFLKDEWARGYASMYYDPPVVFLFAITREDFELSTEDPEKFLNAICTSNGVYKSIWTVYPRYDALNSLHLLEKAKPLNDVDFEKFYNIVVEAGEELVKMPDSTDKKEQLADYIYLCRKMMDRVLK